MSRKDDPVFNVKFVQLIESHPCLWNSTLPAYSKKEEIQKAWQNVANETKDTVRNCRERWRTIRSSFLRSLKLARTSTGRGKRKYYLSKYLQFLIPYTKSRLKPGTNIITLKKSSSLPPMTRINHMPMTLEDTKDSHTTSEVAVAEEDVVVSLQEDANANHQHRLTAIKTEFEDELITPPEHKRRCTNTTITTTTTNNATTTGTGAGVGLGTGTGTGTGAGTGTATTAIANGYLMESQQRSSPGVDLTEFAEWIKSKNDHQRHCLLTRLPDADQSFLNSLHPFLKEMTGKQNRRFRQKVVALIDAILDNVE